MDPAVIKPIDPVIEPTKNCKTTSKKIYISFTNYFW